MLVRTTVIKGLEISVGKYVEISVTDTGCGMTEEVLEKATEPYFTTREAGKGSGLGLSTVYGFARESNGAVDIMSEIDRGTTVTIILPVAENLLD